MKKHQGIFLLFCFFQPSLVRANPVKGISDFDGSFREVERINFECPFKSAGNIQKANPELDVQQTKKKCWIDFHPTFLNVMNKQNINKKDIVAYWQSPPSSGKCCASWNFIYKDDEGNNKILSMRKNEFPFPLTKKKLKILGTPSNIINRWLSQ